MGVSSLHNLRIFGRIEKLSNLLSHKSLFQETSTGMPSRRWSVLSRLIRCRIISFIAKIKFIIHKWINAWVFIWPHKLWSASVLRLGECGAPSLGKCVKTNRHHFICSVDLIGGASVRKTINFILHEWTVCMRTCGPFTATHHSSAAIYFFLELIDWIYVWIITTKMIKAKWQRSIVN